MATRRQAREWTLQLLFRLDVNPSRELDEAFRDFWAETSADLKARQFAESLVRTVRDNMETIDGVITRYAEHWDLRRMGIVDRNALRMGISEMLFREDIPHVVSINEAVDVVKYFSNDESGRFVNGILDRVRKDIECGTVRDGRSAAGKP
jgi:N utilization substance protein B